MPRRRISLIRRPAMVLLWSALIHVACHSISWATSTGPNLEWARQIGTSDFDQSTGVSADALGNVFVVGATTGTFAGPRIGGYDAFIAKYNAAGTSVWSAKFGSSGNDSNNGVAVDGLGNAYVTGYTEGSLGATNAGALDAYLAKYDSNGNQLWIRQLGTSTSDNGMGVSVDTHGNVYISGNTGGNLGGSSAGGDDAFLAKYDGTGNFLWARQLGTNAQDYSKSVSADALGNVFIAGSTYGNLAATNPGSSDVFLAKYDSSGNLVWTRQLGTNGEDDGNSVSADGLGNVYIGGATTGILAGTNAGSADAFISKYDLTGHLLWTRQFGSVDIDIGQAVSADHLGNVYLAGEIYGSLVPNGSTSNNAFVSKYDASGNNVWFDEFGTNKYDQCLGASADGLGNLYVSGETQGGLGSAFLGGTDDAFAAKFTDAPEPTAGHQAIIFSSMLYLWQKRRDRKHYKVQLLV